MSLATLMEGMEMAYLGGLAREMYGRLGSE